MVAGIRPMPLCWIVLPIPARSRLRMNSWLFGEKTIRQNTLVFYYHDPSIFRETGNFNLPVKWKWYAGKWKYTGRISKLKEAGIKNLYLIAGDDLWEKDYEGTTDVLIPTTWFWPDAAGNQVWDGSYISNPFDNNRISYEKRKYCLH